MTDFDNVHEAAGWIRARTAGAPDVAIVLGSGLGDFASSIKDATTFDYGDIPHWPASKVVGHAGRLVIGALAGKRVAALAGRAHFYEGHPLRKVTFATRVMAAHGVKTLILTNAAGGINLSFKPGTLMAMDDHINLMGSNPLVGDNDERFGPRFPDMSEVYSKRLRTVAADVPVRKASTWRTASTLRCTDPATKRQPRFVFSAPSVPTRSACRPRPRRSWRDTWASTCLASRASPTWRPACCRSRSCTTR